MNLTLAGARRTWAALVAAGLALAAPPASAQWSNVAAIPARNVFSVWANADTVLATVDTAVFVSTNAGTSWQKSSKPVADVQGIAAARLRNGRLFAGTFAQGVFVSDDLGATWQPFNQGLVGGFLDSQLHIVDFEQRGSDLFVGTSGAGVYVRNLASADTWHHFGEQFEPNQASNIDDLALGGTRLIAAGGANGMVFIRDPGAPEWTTSLLGNGELLPAIGTREAIWTGTGWVVGTNRGIFRSTQGQEPWTFLDLAISPFPMANTAFALRGSRIFAAFDVPNFAVIQTSADDGASWQLLEIQPQTFVFKMAVSGENLFAGRGDGLWVRGISTVSVAHGGAITSGLRFGLASAQPVHDSARLHFELAEAADATIEVFDVTGRPVGEPVHGAFASGPHDVSWSAQSLRPGVYEARISVGPRAEVVRLVHVQ